ncbi:MAG: shikimate dehydrogenase, partial [Pseudomonadota bacterium]
MTRVFGVIGDPIAHSLSPVIQNGWLRDHGIDGEYLAMHVPKDSLGESLESLARRGISGLNVTLPHKQGALDACGSLTDRAEAIGSVNTLWRPGDGEWHGDNTDAPGFNYAFNLALDTAPSDQTNRPVLVIGAGGAALAVAYDLGKNACPAIFCNRTVARAERLIEVYDRARGTKELDPAKRSARPLSELPDALEEAYVVINATSLGHAGQSIDSWPNGRGRLVYDLSYGNAAKTFLGPAAIADWVTVDGLW